MADLAERTRTCAPADFALLLTEPGPAQLIDVREPAEYAAEHLPAVQLMPLTQLPALSRQLDPQRPVYVLCRSGNRAKLAATQLQDLGFVDMVVVMGGIKACLAAGLPVVQKTGGVWALERQVRFAAGLLVMAGVALGTAVHPGWYGLSGVVGAGLAFAGLTDTCGMAMLLARMPWNQRAGVVCQPS